jgi:dihydrofolate reductase
MRNVICAMNFSIDGCYDHTKLNGNEEIHEYFADLLKDVDLTITGRKMYEIVNPYWMQVARNRSGTAGGNKFAERIMDTETIVISTTMQEVEGGPRIIRGNLVEEVRRLKELPGKKISIGGMSVREQIIAAGLIDEFYMVIQPAIVGPGPRLFDQLTLPATINMELANVKTMKCGSVGLHYIKA